MSASTRPLRRLAAAAIALGALSLSVAPALAADSVTTAANALHQNHLYVEPGETVLQGADLTAVQQAMASAPANLYLAVLTDADATAANATSLPASIGRTGNFTGIVGVVSNNALAAGGHGTGLPQGAAENIAQTAARAHQGRAGDIVSFISTASAALKNPSSYVPTQRSRPGAGTRTNTAPAPAPQKSSHTGLYIFLFLLLIGIVVLVAFIFNRGKKRREEEAREVASLKADVENELQSLESDLSINAPAASINPEGDADKAFATAWARHDLAASQVLSIKTPEDAARVQTTVRQGRAALQDGLNIKSGKPAPAAVFAAAASLAKAGKAPSPTARMDAPPRGARLPQQQTITTYNTYNYPGYGYGYYPGYGYGYWGYDGSFFAGMLMGELIMGGGYGWGPGYGYDYMYDGGYGPGYGDYDDGYYGGDFDGGYGGGYESTDIYDNGGGDFGGGYDGGGSDFGGGYDSGGSDFGGGGGYDGGGSDFGGGGFDGGGSDFGGGDSGGGGDW